MGHEHPVTTDTTEPPTERGEPTGPAPPLGSTSETVLEYLADNGGMATVDELAGHLATTRARRPTNNCRGDPETLELADLVQRRLPRLVEADAVRVVDDDQTLVELRPVDERPSLGSR